MISFAIISVWPILASYFSTDHYRGDLETILFLNSYLKDMNATCREGTYYTKAICFYQPENVHCLIYCKDYRLLCLDGKYVLLKDEENFACHSIEEWKAK